MLIKRIFDFLFSPPLPSLCSPILLTVGVAVKCSSRDSVLYGSDRVGKDNVLFKMLKLRTMEVNTPEVGTHLFIDSHQYLTRFGSLLRKYRLDEMPQLWSVLKGDMSLVGPRPALFNQDDLLILRTGKKGV